MKILFTLFVTGVLFICPGSSIAQIAGNSLRLKADLNYVTIDDTSGKSLNDAMTWEFWIYNRCESDATVFAITKGWCNTDWSYYIAVKSDSGQLIFSKFKHGPSNCDNQPLAQYSSNTGVIPYNTWTHVAVVMINSAVLFYTNGLPATIKLTAGNSFSGLQTSAEPVLIGAYHSAISNGNTYAGVPKANIDEVRIWHVARTASEILNNFKSALTGNEMGLIAYYQFNETGSGAGIAVVNSAANGLLPNGTTRGTPLFLEFENNSTIVNTSPDCSVLLKRYFRDFDQDGYGNISMNTFALIVPPGYVSDSTDCNDSNVAVHPGAVEICGNGIDENCDGIDGVCAGALNFDGLNDQVYVGNSQLLNTPYITVQAWIKMDNVYAYHGVVTKRNCCNDLTMFQWSMQTSPSGLMSWAINTGKPNLIGTADSNPVPAGEWVNYTGTFDGTKICLYKNGLLVSSNTVNPDSIVAMSWPFIIGARDAATTDFFSGSIDEVRIWNKALTQQEILANINCRLTGTEPGLVAYYDFSQGIADYDNSSVNMLLDRGPNGLNGQLQNFALNGTTSNWVVSPLADRPVSIIRQPSDTTITEGDNVFFVVASPDSAASFQWQTDSAGTGFHNIYDNGLYLGTNLNTLTLQKATVNRDQLFRCIVAAPFTCAGTSASAELKVLPLPPYALLTFDGERFNKIVRLRWAATHEKHISYYNVERSRDSITFNFLGKVTAVSNDDLHFYSYIDSMPWPEDIYYRLNIFDAAGNHRYSRIKKIISQGQVLNIYPNPSTGKFTVEINMPYVALATDIVVRTMLGQTIYRIRTTSTITNIDLGSNLASGCYVVQILNAAGETMGSRKLIVIPRL